MMMKQQTNTRRIELINIYNTHFDFKFELVLIVGASLPRSLKERD